jgi:hypothetical protein
MDCGYFNRYAILRPEIEVAMDQRIETTSQAASPQRPKKLGGRTGKGFMPGKSGNPKGRPSIKAQLQAALQVLIAGFVKRYGRKPDDMELNDLEQIAWCNVTPFLVVKNSRGVSAAFTHLPAFDNFAYIPFQKITCGHPLRQRLSALPLRCPSLKRALFQFEFQPRPNGPSPGLLTKPDRR